MRRRLPPSNALEVFETAARTGSFARAAEELHVTASAISHRIKALEAELGVALFVRGPQKLELSAAGRTLFPVVADALDRIALGLERLRGSRDERILTVSTSQGFASKWLVHRLGRFAELHPEIQLRIGAAPRLVDFAAEDVDLAIRYSDGSGLEGLHATPLGEEWRTPVCNPALLSGERPLRAPADLASQVLIHLDDHRHWTVWLEAAGLEGIDPSRGPIYDQSSLTIDAAIAGQGVALARSTLAARDLLAGRLARPFDLKTGVRNRYWLVTPRAAADRPKIATFRAWALEEARHEAEALDRLTGQVATP